MEIRFGGQVATLVGVTLKLLSSYAGYFSIRVILYYVNWTLGCKYSSDFTC